MTVEQKMEQYHGMMWYWLRRFKVDRDEDFVSEARMVLFRCVMQFDPSLGFKFGTLFARAIWNAFQSLWHKQRRWTRLDFGTDLRIVPGRERDDGDEIDWDRVLLTLPANERKAVRMRYWHDQPARAIGAAVGCSESMAKVLIYQALDRLRENPRVLLVALRRGWITETRP